MYITIVETSSAKLDERVNKEIDRGYIPIGNPSVCINSKDELTLVQSLIDLKAYAAYLQTKMV